MDLLNKSGMRELLDELVKSKAVQVLGICVGMQILAYSSEEGILPGLCWVNAKVKKIDISAIEERTRLPHMGWKSWNRYRTTACLKGLNEKPDSIFCIHIICNA